MRINVSFILIFWPEILKKSDRGKIEKFTWNKFSKVFIEIPGTSRSYRHTKKSVFGVDITRLFLHRRKTRNISCRGNAFNPKICLQVFRTNPYTSSIIYRFMLGIKLVMNISPNGPKFTDKIASGVLVYIYITYLKCKTEWNYFLENFRWHDVKLKQALTKKYIFCSNNLFLAI